MWHKIYTKLHSHKRKYHIYQMVAFKTNNTQFDCSDNISATDSKHKGIQIFQLCIHQLPPPAF